MTLQTVEQLLPLLELLQQPAFCVDQSGRVFSNAPARPLAPDSGDALPQWLEHAAETYTLWDRQGTLNLPVVLQGQTIAATLSPLADGTLFLLSDCAASAARQREMAVTAQVLRQPLTDLCAMTQQLTENLEDMEDPLLQAQTAAMTRHLYRLSRITCDLADLSQLQSGRYPARPEKLELAAFLQDFTVELQDLCEATGHQLHLHLPEQQIMVSADSVLLERALLNLLSNALKYSEKKTDVELRADATASNVYFRFRNHCAQEDQSLLSAAFQRLTQRDGLPDPRWGLGLGLPLALSIARTMGGTIAVDSHDGFVTVTMSISRKRRFQDTAVRTQPAYDYTGGMRRTLVELSDVLPSDCYDSNAI